MLAVISKKSLTNRGHRELFKSVLLKIFKEVLVNQELKDLGMPKRIIAHTVWIALKIYNQEFLMLNMPNTIRITLMYLKVMILMRLFLNF